MTTKKIEKNRERKKVVNSENQMKEELKQGIKIKIKEKNKKIKIIFKEKEIIKLNVNKFELSVFHYFF